MGIVLDVILIVIILLNVIICYKKGLVKISGWISGSNSIFNSCDDII